ncbi:MAG: hypothetical protein JW833_13585, partial [Prolixibacteraceae bacterium]|nr:hypothetical protein [Prolixibacteraceae bacterium]
EKEKLYSEAPELGNYVCRQCKKCDGILKINPSEIFMIEGIFDRQMEDGFIPDPSVYALRERLKHWFGQKEKALKEYIDQSVKVDPENDYSELNKTCPCNIDINRKLKLAHSKLSKEGYLF